jgi:hypothetical protein
MNASYLVLAHSSNEHYNADCDYAVVTLTSDFLKQLHAIQMAHADMKKRLQNFSSFELFDFTAEFISHTTAKELIGEANFDPVMGMVPTEEPVLLPLRSGYVLKVEARADYLVVTGRGIWWSAYPKATDVRVESEQIDWAWFAQCRHCAQHEEVHVAGKCLFLPTSYEARHAIADSSSKDRNSRRRQRKRAL